MPGFLQKPPTGYLETEYSSDWPGLVTNLPSSRIPPGAASACNAMCVRGRITPPPSIWNLTTAYGGGIVNLPTFASGENICAFASIPIAGTQNNSTIIITNKKVYIDYTAGTAKTFNAIYTFPNPYPRYAHIGYTVIGNSLYFSSASQLGLYQVRPLYHVTNVRVTNPGGYFTSAPSVVFSDGAGVGALATASISGGNISNITVTNGGGLFVSPPIVSFNGGTASGPSASQNKATGVAILSTLPDSYTVQEVSAYTGVATIALGSGGSGYVNPTVLFVGGGGTGASATASVSGGVITSITLASGGINFTSTPTIVIVDAGGGTGATATATLESGLPFIGGDFLTSLSGRMIIANVIGGDGNGTMPTGGTVPIAQSSQTKYLDRVAWSGSNAYWSFDPNYTSAPGGFNTVAEAKGLLTSANVIESVCYLGHNGGVTEMSPNTGSSIVPFSFYPLWSADLGIVVRYGSMAQYGSTLAFLSVDSAWSLSPNGLNEIGANISNLLQEETLQVNNINPSIWNNQSFPLYGLYGSIVVIEGQKHYLLAATTDDPFLQLGNTSRRTLVFDYNMNENNWHTWQWSGYTLTCPIYQSLDSFVNPSSSFLIQLDNWILFGWTVSAGSSAPYTDSANVYEAVPLTLQYYLLHQQTNNTFLPPVFSYQYRTESPSIARMLQERRLLVEYENSSYSVVVGPSVLFTFVGQQDPTSLTGPTPVSSQSTFSSSLNFPSGFSVPNQVLTQQVDFGTFTGTCTSFSMSSTLASNNGLAIVRVTSVSDIAKGQVP